MKSSPSSSVFGAPRSPSLENYRRLKNGSLEGILRVVDSVVHTDNSASFRPSGGLPHRMSTLRTSTPLGLGKTLVGDLYRTADARIKGARFSLRQLLGSHGPFRRGLGEHFPLECPMYNMSITNCKADSARERILGGRELRSAQHVTKTGDSRTSPNTSHAPESNRESTLVLANPVNDVYILKVGPAQRTARLPHHPQVNREMMKGFRR